MCKESAAVSQRAFAARGGGSGIVAPWDSVLMGKGKTMVPELIQVSEYVWELPATGGMRVPGRVYADARLVEELRKEQSLNQVANVAHLPGILCYSLAMPDIHFGYGFPIGGVAAFAVEDGVVSPGGVGYDINCGCRLLATDLEEKEIGADIRKLVDQLFRDVPSGVGARGAIAKLSRGELEQLLVEGAAWTVKRGYGSENDLEHTEDGGALPRPTRARSANGPTSRLRPGGHSGLRQPLPQVQAVDEIFDREAAEAYGLREGQITLMVHCGSRSRLPGLRGLLGSHGLRDKEVSSRASRPPTGLRTVTSPGQPYLAAMACAANYAWASRQMIMHLTEQALLHALRISPRSLNLRLVYDVAHNIAKLETHQVVAPRRHLRPPQGRYPGVRVGWARNTFRLSCHRAAGTDPGRYGDGLVPARERREQ